MEKIKIVLGKISYGALFIFAVPALIICWAINTEEIIRLPIPENPFCGYALLITGFFFVTTAMINLWVFGKGLPMNAFPPKKFVKVGIYSFTKNPIYAGTVSISFGLSLILKTSSGFWFVSPLFALMIVAFVVGFENERTLSVFGIQNYQPFLSLPLNSDKSPSVKDRIASFILAFIPWLIIYEAFVFVGKPIDAVATNISFEDKWPVLEFSFIFYSSVYLYTLIIPIVIKTKKELRRFIIDAWFATVVAGIIFFTFPFIVIQRAFTPHSFFGELILYDRSFDSEAAALPSFHVIWAGISTYYFSISIRKYKWIWYTFALFISVSCITTGNHSLLDVLAGIFIFLIVIYRTKIWNFLRMQSEIIANSWTEWRCGSVRIINHGFYAGAAAFGATIIAGSFSGGQNAIACFITCILGISGACIWAQVVEGSPKLLRPFGYYGSVIGIITSCILMIFIFPINFFVFLASFAMAAPWVQIIGRFRCLVQGCCHGKPSNDWIGIRFSNRNSRVIKISGLQGVALHPTQLYSIGTNIVTMLILIRLYDLELPASFITGIYFILNGLGRFIEESFRGEVQTPYWAGMKIYQWIAIVCILGGSILTTIQSPIMPTFQLSMQTLYWAFATGIIAIVAYGVDFPFSNKRFARLTIT